MKCSHCRAPIAGGQQWYKADARLILCGQCLDACPSLTPAHREYLRAHPCQSEKAARSKRIKVREDLPGQAFLFEGVPAHPANGRIE